MPSYIAIKNPSPVGARGFSFTVPPYLIAKIISNHLIQVRLQYPETIPWALITVPSPAKPTQR